MKTIQAKSLKQMKTANTKSLKLIKTAIVELSDDMLIVVNGGDSLRPSIIMTR